MKEIVAIQGIEGSYHHQTAQEYFDRDIQIIPCDSFDKVAQKLLNQEASMGIMAIENTIAGAILPNYNLIDKHQLYIVGEHYIDIQHQLMAIQGQHLEDLTEVHSHYMALLQCKDFFVQYPHIKLVEDSDTASTARRIKQGNLRGIGAIASVTAAHLFGLEILATNIQTMKNNATRFVILQKEKPLLYQKTINKASIKFQLDHKRGSLATVLNVISDCDLNMTKIQSLPVVHQPWKYAFFVDVTFDKYTNFQKVIQLLDIMAEDIKILGEYQNQLD
ncbi:prephenate dehydratase [Capnocytophaga catalasegens]|uniref:prephenate dehydratase n=1 Tax=Capnocytophaga catalasegens TaxID=1004260 RepID=A0AAV5AZS2_9FLAO|nr:prephenate dehydratase [Capnocytophaga catalasegens]GIZ14296.1 prephenate dehydratase [Capnocytophaga catalasegens]GJM51293.1 prephenate dehydratase [Capnocytophaga catalasegens]GJM53290.1 prephenate dehydratase [Capnocytophaga catalasegens]